MNIAKSSESLDLFMNDEELEDFKRYLNIAIEDLVNVRPTNPKKYFALALCRAIPIDDNIRYDFPELAKDLFYEEVAKATVQEEIILDAHSNNL